MPHSFHSAALLATGLLAACGSSSAPQGDTATPAIPTPASVDRHCDLAAWPSPKWTQCEAQNFARTTEAPLEMLAPAFLARMLAQTAINGQQLLTRNLADPSWLLTNTVLGYCANYGGPCAGDPFRYPEADGPDGAVFFEQEALVTPVVFYDAGCARLSGHVWRPRQLAAGQTLPAIVVANGSIGAPQVSYWWAVQPLVRAGYQVLTYDPRGQGRSDFITPTGGLGTNAKPQVFWQDLVDAIDFLRSTPVTPYPHNLHCTGRHPTTMTAHNPEHASLDPERIGIAGHSLGAIAVSVVQGYGAPGANPWPGQLDRENPVKAAVAWDSLINPDGSGGAPFANQAPLPELYYDAAMLAITLGQLPHFAPRVPSMSFNADYGLLPAVSYVTDPDPETHKQVLRTWQAAGVPVYSLGFQGTTHIDYSPIAGLPSTSWCADTSSGACRGGYGQPAIVHYTLAWLDRWLKQPGEPGYTNADARLLDDGGSEGAVKMSFHYRSARDYPDRSGQRQHCEDIRAGC